MSNALRPCPPALLLACLLAVSPSFAGEASGARDPGVIDVDAPLEDEAERARAVAAARPHFSRGVEMYRAGAYDAALAAFARAYEIAPTYRILYNLAQVQAQRQDYVQALELFARYLREGKAMDPARRPSEERVAAVQAEMTELRRRVAELRIEANLSGATLVVNELRVAELPLQTPLWLNAGIHRIRVEKPGYAPAAKVVTVAGGEARELRFELVREDFAIDIEALPAPRGLPVDAPPPPPPSRVPVSVGLVTTGLLAAATAVSGVMMYQQSGELDRRLSSYPEGLARIEASRSRLRTLAVTTDILALASMAAAGVTTYLYLSTPESAPPRSGKRRLPAAPGTATSTAEHEVRERAATQLGATVGAQGATLWLRGAL